ncbi:hypothetical protein SAMN02746095_02592 [Acidocella aminolytica 101 = DSM 11237]|nr:hypothetical protein SAMN02746095_02592 [Acidocella aminolytica 101 = DSM 11237]
MSGTMKLIIAALIGAGVVAGGGAFYVYVIAPPSVQNSLVPLPNSGRETNAQIDAGIRASCLAAGKDAVPACKPYLDGKTSN